jgi:hypothetical protein
LGGHGHAVNGRQVAVNLVGDGVLLCGGAGDWGVHGHDGVHRMADIVQRLVGLVERINQIDRILVVDYF